MAGLIGARLIEEGVLTPAEVEQTLAAQAREGGRFCSTALALGFADEWPLVEALGRQRGAPGVCPSALFGGADDLFSEGLSERLYAMPARALRQTLYVLMRDPDDEAALGAIRAATARRLRPLIALESSLRLELARRAEAPLEIHPPLPPPTARLRCAPGLGDLAARISALVPEASALEGGERVEGEALLLALGDRWEGLADPHPRKLLLCPAPLPASLHQDLLAREDIAALLTAGMTDEALRAAVEAALVGGAQRSGGEALKRARGLHQAAREAEATRRPWAALAGYEAALRVAPDHLPSLHDGARLAESLRLKGHALALWQRALALTPRPALAEALKARMRGLI
ncbi:hypothetical protein KKF91_10645 [Myxococcota bacterium]|nr:hypothetical protein [Myxococcota bacterium]MBU1430989.1 hypothetical protein [Myxococcota bacterium]MBU1897216.1 hypothetical protein [Myxococcota bacterium]